jgi:hypothetical protein
MNCSVYEAHGERRDAGFYLTSLEYGHYLWQRRFAARAMLCLDRAMGAEVQAHESEIQSWPMPYAGMAWFLTHVPEGVFIGNPRVHFQHYADRLKAPRRDIRRWRAWACWGLTRRIHPTLLGDPKHPVTEPTISEIAAGLETHGLHGEADQWHAIWSGCAARISG